VRRRTLLTVAAVVIVVTIAIGTRLADLGASAGSGVPSSAAASAAIQSPGDQPPDTTGWLDANGAPLAPVVIEEIQGPEHCGWESTTWLRLRGALYIRDPQGLLTASTIGRFEPDAVLPTDARSTGFHQDGRTIWQTGDPSVIYVVTSNQVERWPRAVDPTMGCA
jgi:hypothetical protein